MGRLALNGCLLAVLIATYGVNPILAWVVLSVAAGLSLMKRMRQPLEAPTK